MKPIFDLPRIVAIVAMIPVTLSLAACGQKGPLFMPAKLPPPIVRTAPAPAKPNVAPATSDEAITPAQPEAVDIPTTIPVTR
ncbi:prokaryotic lipo-attachment site family protein [Collimonas fungivorans]|uniref:Prokaryotic lipo-attachment site family protein n=1 Tax=Collimonas fungivorans TaxID=158899 RepID=A0A127P6E6_9BURK|nr:lipoprotein [Collimonas fungivorans]AMO93386.1 prokaryotic lipo-attachment site family protein [Collimonas fungivorans]